jgi:hypothetical protein
MTPSRWCEELSAPIHYMELCIYRQLVLSLYMAQLIPGMHWESPGLLNRSHQPSISEVHCFCLLLHITLYSASHSRVAPENVGLQKEQKYNIFACHTCMKCGCVFWEFGKRKLATRKDKIIKMKREATQPACRSRCQSVVRRGARCLLAFTS